MSLWLKIIRAALEEKPLNNVRETRKRIEACNGCSSLNKEKRKCRICSCYVDIKAEMEQNLNPKRNLAIEVTHCPKNKWNQSKHMVNYYNRLNGFELIN